MLEPNVIGRHHLPLAEVTAERTEGITAMGAASLLKPAFDILWNAAGVERCRHYDQSGNWRK